MVNVEAIFDFLSECELDSDLSEDDFYDKIISHLPKDISYKYDNGVTKVVIIFPGADYVIKIPFTGEWGYDDDDNAIFFEFKSGSECVPWDYCQGEVEKYELAENEEIEQFFAKTECIGHLHGHPIYIQERAEILGKIDGHQYPLEKRTPIKTKCREQGFRCFDANWAVDLFEYCEGEEGTFNAVMHFATQYLSDLHCDNIGYINGRPVLVDYAGYNS